MSKGFKITPVQKKHNSSNNNEYRDLEKTLCASGSEG